MGRLAAEAERVPNIVGQILDIATLVVVRQNDGVFLFFKVEDFLCQIKTGNGHTGINRAILRGRQAMGIIFLLPFLVMGMGIS